MANKDLTQKALLRVPDVFASLVNLILFKNEQFVQPHHIRYLDITSPFDYDSSLKPIYRDTCALITNEENNPLFIVNFENQSRRDRTMPIRALGYTDTIYFWQRSRLLKPSSSDIPLSKFIPSLTIVLHYGLDLWKPETLSEIIHLDQFPFLKPYVSGYTMNLENIAWWSEEKIHSINSDFRFIADYLVQIRKSTEKGKPKYDPPVHWEIEHVEETLMTLAAFTTDRNLADTCYKYLKQFHLDKKKGKITMASVIDHIEERGEQKGFLKAERKYQKIEKEWNKERGEMLSSLVLGARHLMSRQGITAEEACDYLGYSEKTRKLVLPYLVN